MILIYYLEPDDLQKVLDLQNRIYAFLKEQSNPRFIVPRTEAYFTEHLDSPHKIAARKVMTGSMLRRPFSTPRTILMSPSWSSAYGRFEHGMRASVLQGMLIDPAMRGQGLMSRFIEQWQVCVKIRIYHIWQPEPRPATAQVSITSKNTVYTDRR